MTTFEVGNVILAALAAVVAGVAAWFVSAARVRARLEERVRRTEGRLDLAVGRNREIRDAIDSVQSMLTTFVPEHLEEAVAGARARTELALENAERRLLEAVARRFAALERSLDSIRGSLAALERSSGRTAEMIQGMPDVSEEIQEIDARLKEALAELGESLGPRLAELGGDVRRSRDAIDTFRWEALRGGRPLPWDEPAGGG